jgi:hypothetical protein
LQIDPTRSIPGRLNIHPHPPDIIGVEGPGVLEAGPAVLATQHPVHDLATVI